MIEKKIYKKTYTNITLNGEKHEASSLRWKRNSFPLGGRRQKDTRESRNEPLYAVNLFLTKAPKAIHWGKDSLSSK